jgi:hypothetical protein
MTDGGHVDDLVAERALRVLPPEEEAAVDGHVEICPMCNARLQEVQEVAHLLVFAVRPARPPGYCKVRLMERVEREAFLERPAARPAQRTDWTRWVPAGVLIVALLLWNVQLQRALHQQQMIAETMAADARPSPLRPQGTVRAAATRMAARMYKARNATSAVLVVENLPPLPAGKVYQIWVADDLHQQPMESFQPRQPLDEIMMEAAVPLTAYKWVMITIEDAGGSQVPSKTTVLLGDL